MNNTVQDAFASGARSYQDASRQMQEVSANLAQSNRQNIDIPASAASMQQASLQAQASAEVMKRADSMVGTIIDVFA
ncbi:hypothetical protein ACFO4O_00510 [Glaciecola siphonariae]|uniref:Uncharacterized protein n=1 Tax=Glaciecola siphonariae TaxID=521012 RepID=A0ABV9LQZ9_9ALTE